VARRRAAEITRAADALTALAAKGGGESATLAFEGAAWRVRAAVMQGVATAAAEADALKPEGPTASARARLERALARAASPTRSAELRAVATDRAATDIDVATARLAAAEDAFAARRDEDVVVECAWLFTLTDVPLELTPSLAEALVLAGKASRRLVDATIDPAKRRTWWNRAIDFQRRASELAWDVPAVDEAKRL
jgi:hypothetical protein